MTERRDSNREEVLFPATLSIGETTLAATLRNLSEGGALLEAESPEDTRAKPGDECLLNIRLHDGGARVLPSRIVRTFDLGVGRLGLAVTF